MKIIDGEFVSSPAEVVKSFFRNEDYGKSPEEPLETFVFSLTADGVSDDEMLVHLSGDFRKLATVVDQNWDMGRNWRPTHLREALRTSSLEQMKNISAGLRDQSILADQTAFDWLREDLTGLMKFYSGLMRRKVRDIT